MGDLAEMVSGFLPDAQISFDSEGSKEDSGSYLVSNSRLFGEFELEYLPLQSRILEIVNEVRWVAVGWLKASIHW